MSANSTPNRASLLSGLRTGGVRSAVPHTAAPGGSFNIPRFSVFNDGDSHGQTLFVNHAPRNIPMTAAPTSNNRFMQQQQIPPVPFSPGFAGQPNHAQAQALQMQMMQLQLLQMQAIQAQQYQSQLIAHNSPQSARRPNFNPPATAGPTASFDLRSADQSVPMSAALGGKFGSRPSAPIGHYATDGSDSATTVISGGTSLGTPTPTVSKSETATNWRRGGNNNSVLRQANRPVLGKSSPPPTERRLSPPPTAAAPAGGKFRGQPLSIGAAQAMPAVAIESEAENDDGYSTSSSESAASITPPTTPPSSDLSVSPPKDAATKAMPLGLKVVSQPSRQPRGPPSGPDELGPRNFAARAVKVVVA